MARIKGSSRTQEFVPTVKLVSMSQYPLGTIVSMWIGSRYQETISAKDIEELYYSPDNRSYTLPAKKLCEYYPEYAGEDGNDYENVIYNVAKLVIKSNLPPLDAVNFTFEIDNANVAWREQVVRGRAPQNFWMQTSRTADLTTMDINRLPSIKEYGGDEAVKIYDDAVDSIREAYKKLTELGVPSEDIRLIPQGMTHRVYWMVPFRTLSATLSKRMSWIAQATLWSPILIGIQKELFKYAPFFADVLGTPADVRISEGKVVGHTYDNENEDRYYGRDSQPCDPLWLAYRGYKAPDHTNKEMYDKLKELYTELWSNEICSILGWDKNDTTTKGPYDV